MMFKMPDLGRRQIDILTSTAMSSASWALSTSDYGPKWANFAEEASAVFKAWVDYGRQTFPNEQSRYMLDYERHHGAGIRFDEGDHWEFDATADSWVVVKPNGKRMVTREPRP